MSGRQLPATQRPVTMKALLEWAIGVKRADRVLEWSTKASPADYASHVSADGLAAIERLGQLMTQVDCAGSLRLDRGTLDPDAEEVYLTARRELDRRRLWMVLDAARLGQAPDWGRDLKPVRAAFVKAYDRQTGVSYPKECVVQAGPRRRRYAIRWNPVEYVSQAERLEDARDHYRLWWLALAHLAAAFEAAPGRLRHWRVVGVGAERDPWAQDRPQKIA